MTDKTTRNMLIISLIFNLLLAISLLLPRFFPKNRPLPPPFPEERLNLQISRESQEKLRELIRKFKIEENYQREQVFSIRGEIIDQLSKEEIDFEYLSELVQDINKIENNLNRKFVDLLTEISLNLKDSERIKALLMLSGRWLLPIHERRKQ
jgi:hypothetical protein